MSQATDNNKRIAKNTLLLYFRMLITMVVSLYTSRVVLQALGVQDYGIYNVVGGVVAMFSVISGSLSASISRFITFELGRKNNEKLIRVFSSSVTIQIILAAIVIVLAETIGLWFLNTKMVIPADRLIASNWVYQLSLFTFVINIVSIPYNAAIIAHECMKAFAYISVLEAIGKLIVAYLIMISPIDKMVMYASLLAFISVIIRIIYGIYCKKRFEECSYTFIYDLGILKQIFSFAGWNFIGASSSVLKTQGCNVVINLFCGPTVNAARGLSEHVSNAISSFASNFMTALNPQITKSYAVHNKTYLMILLFQGSKLSFYLLLIVSLPILLNTHYILSLWLEEVPKYTVEFVQLSLILSMSDTISTPLITAQLATGKIRNYQIVVGGLQMLNLPVSYVLLYFGFDPKSVFVVAIILSQICLAARLFMLHRMIGLSVMEFLTKVYLNLIIVSIASALLPMAMKYMIDDNLVNVIFHSLMTIVVTIFVFYAIGCNKNEKAFILGKAMAIMNKIKNKMSR